MWTLLLWVGAALAGPVDLIGFGSPAIGRGGGGVALVDGAQGVFRNPAGLADMPGAQAVLGAQLVRGRFDQVPDVWWDTNRDGLVTDADSPLQVNVQPDPADAIWLALGRPIGSRFGIALNATIPVQRVLRVQTFEPSLPNYAFLDNQAQRFDMALGFGWEQLPGLSVGLSVEVIARTRLTFDATLDVTLTGAGKDGQDLSALIGDLTLDPHAMTLDIVPGLAPVAAVYWDVGKLLPALDGLAIGTTYRGASGLPVDVGVDLQANFNIEDVGSLDPVGVTLVVPLNLSLYDHYVPARWAMGAAWSLPDRLRLYVDVNRTMLAAMPLSIAHTVNTEVQSQLLSLADPVVGDGNEVDVTLRNTWSTRGGAEISLPRWDLGGEIGWLQGVLRVGAGYQPTPLVSQGTDSAVLDADRLILAGGLGVAHGDPFGLIAGPISWDAHVQVQTLGRGTLPVDTTPYRPGAPVDQGGLPIGGKIWMAGLQCAINY
ncbi:MAG: hypothetical protein GXP62_13010 [Oligoflexia bacterium]|nr:hypothetical protein [Oligoflexia bacterium]